MISNLNSYLSTKAILKFSLAEGANKEIIYHNVPVKWQWDTPAFHSRGCKVKVPQELTSEALPPVSSRNHGSGKWIHPIWVSFHLGYVFPVPWLWEKSMFVNQLNFFKSFNRPIFLRSDKQQKKMELNLETITWPLVSHVHVCFVFPSSLLGNVASNKGLMPLLPLYPVLRPPLRCDQSATPQQGHQPHAIPDL